MPSQWFAGTRSFHPLFWRGAGRSGSRRAKRRRPVAPSLSGAIEQLELRTLLASAGLSVSPATLIANEANPVAFDVFWSPDGDGSADSVGLNLRLHYDSSALQFDALDNLFADGFSAQQDVAEADDVDDGDANTDRVFKVLWFDVGGNWPGVGAGTRLLTATFTTQLAFEATAVNVRGTGVDDTPLPQQQIAIEQWDRPIVTAPGERTLASRPIITWTAPPDATTFDFYLRHVPTGSVTRETLNATQYLPTTDLPIGNYQLWIDGYRGDGTRTGWSDLHTFRVDTPPELTGPGETVKTLTPTVSWNPVAGATGYEAWVSDVNAGSGVYYNTDVNDEQVIVSPELRDGPYRVWVRAKAADTTLTPWSTPRDFTIDTRPEILAPGAETNSLRPTFEWTASAGAESYDFYLQNDSTGQVPIVREIVSGATTFTPTADLPIGAYRVWVQGIRPDATRTRWSLVHNFSIRTPPELTGPSLVVNVGRPKVSWKPLPGAQRYEVWLNSLVPGQTGRVYHNTNVMADDVTLPTTLPNGEYRVWARAFAPDGLSTKWSAERTFTSAARPVVTAPIGATASMRPTIEWTAPADATSFDVYVSNLSTGQNAVVRQTTTSTSLTPGVDLGIGTYRVWIDGYRADGSRTGWSAPVTFQIRTRPILTGPPLLVSTSTPEITWEPLLGAVRYEVWVDAPQAGVSRIYHNTSVVGLSETVSSLPDGLYRVAVRGFAADGLSSFWSRTRDFTITTP